MSCAVKRCSSVSQFDEPADIGGKPASTLLGRVAAPAYRAFQRRRQRKRLLELDDRQLNDIGVTKDQAREEACKPLWR